MAQGLDAAADQPVFDLAVIAPAQTRPVTRHARVDDRIRCAKDTGLGRLPSLEFAINQAWCALAAIAVDLIRWFQLIGLDGELAVAEPKRLRHRILHTAARLTRGQRRRWLRIPSSWPWAAQTTAAFNRIAAIPAPGRPLPRCQP